VDYYTIQSATGKGLFPKKLHKQKSARPTQGRRFFHKGLVLFLHLGEALAAVNRTVFTGFEGNFCLAAAAGANGSEHFSLSFFTGFASVSASFASLWFILEAFFSVELLLTSGEHELGSTFFAYQFFVFVHDPIPRLKNLPTD